MTFDDCNKTISGIKWSTETPSIHEFGQYIVISDDGFGDKRADIEYWDGLCWDGIDSRNTPIKWCKIEY